MPSPKSKQRTAQQARSRRSRLLSAAQTGTRLSDTFSSDFTTMLVSGALGGVAILGYSYSHAFFSSFGLSLYQLNMQWIDLLFRGVFLMQKPGVAICFVVACIVASVVFALRRRFGAVGLVLMSSLTVVLFFILVGWGGNLLGKLDARSIWRDGAGKPATCVFDPEHFDPKRHAVLTNLSVSNQLRLIYRDKDTTVLGRSFAGSEAKIQRGSGFVFPTKSIRYCYVVGARFGSDPD